MENKDMWVLDENKHDEDNVYYTADGKVYTKSEYERHLRYGWKPEPIKDTLSYPYEEAEKKEANFRTRLKEKGKAFREWIGDRDTVITVQIIQGGAIAFLAIANLITLSLVLSI